MPPKSAGSGSDALRLRWDVPNTSAPGRGTRTELDAALLLRFLEDLARADTTESEQILDVLVADAALCLGKRLDQTHRLAERSRVIGQDRAEGVADLVGEPPSRFASSTRSSRSLKQALALGEMEERVDLGRVLLGRFGKLDSRR